MTPRRLAIAIAALPLCAWAGDPVPYTVGMRLHGGFILPHHKSVHILQDRHALGGEVHVQRWFSGGRPWHGHYRRPAWGVSALWMRTGSGHMGNAVRVLPYLELPLTAPGGWELAFRTGWGVGLVQHPFHRVENHKQHAVGSHVNIAAQGALAVRRHLGRHAVDAGIALDHLSNGSMQQPNLGVNIASLSVGWSYRLGDAPPPAPVPDTAWHAAGRRWAEVMVNGGTNEVGSVGTGRGAVVALAASVYHRASAKSAVGAGIDVFNKATAAIVDTALAGRPALARTQAGVHAGYALLFGRLALHAEVGTYIRSPLQESAPIYTRIGMRHTFARRFFANFSLKSHFFVADHFELGLGYR
ncbi:MAG: acyloxyacyl hydrolase, partial [Flavobacteriales bacterium]|nr:acyloxyacyl hydrolase [Flavobacteriales bacterium]